MRTSFKRMISLNFRCLCLSSNSVFKFKGIFMSRFIASTFAIGVFSGAVFSAMPVFAQSLSINPFPMEKATTLSVQPPQMLEEPRVESFAREAEDEILRLEMEKAALKRKLEDAEKAKTKDIGDQSSNAVSDLRRQNEALAKQLAALSQKQSAVEADEVVVMTPMRDRPPVSLKQKNKELARELRAAQAAEREKVDLQFAMDALEAQKKADLAATAVVPSARDLQAVRNAKAVHYDVAAYDGGAGVNMTPMPLKESDMRERVSGMDRPVAPVVSEVVQEKPVSAGNDLTKIKILPSSGYAPQNVAAQSFYPSANAGESLEDVLRSWSQAEGVGFLWKTTMRFDVPKTVSSKGDYAGSVAALLEQFGTQDVRPVGELYVDPVTNFKTLTIMSE